MYVGFHLCASIVWNQRSLQLYVSLNWMLIYTQTLTLAHMPIRIKARSNWCDISLAAIEIKLKLNFFEVWKIHSIASCIWSDHINSY